MYDCPHAIHFLVTEIICRRHISMVTTNPHESSQFYKIRPDKSIQSGGFRSIYENEYEYSKTFIKRTPLGPSQVSA